MIDFQMIKYAIDELVDIIKQAIKDMQKFINGWKTKDGFDEEATEA